MVNHSESLYRQPTRALLYYGHALVGKILFWGFRVCLLSFNKFARRIRVRSQKGGSLMEMNQSKEP